MTSNLTREEAARRGALLAVESYRIELDLHGSDDTFESLTTVRFTCAEPGAEAFIDLTAVVVDQLTLNGRQLPPADFTGHRIRLAGLAAANELTVRAQCAYSQSGEGLHRFTDPMDDAVYLYSNLETFYAHQLYACFDQPDLKAAFEFTVRCPGDWIVISNELPDQAPSPDQPPRPSQDAADTIVTWHFPPTPRLSTYLTAIAAGPYHEVRTEHDGIPLGLYCRRSLAEDLDSEEIFELTAQAFDHFHAEFGVRYPFSKYDQIFVPEFNFGAMENAAATTVAEEFVFRSRVTQARREARAETLVHELAHMWFGDLVTMTWWDDLWLNESFATWASIEALAKATRFEDAWTTFSQDLKAWAYRQDQLPSTHPIVADIDDIESVEVYFDGITYAKGAAVLRQLVAFVGPENFRSGVRRYFERHAWGNATLTDLLDALEQASGRRLHDWSKAWLEVAGVSTLRPVLTASSDGTFGDFAVQQLVPDSHPVLRPHRIAIGLYDHLDGKLRRRKRLEIDISGELTSVPELTGTAIPDLILVNDDDLSFAKVRLDDRSLRTLLDSGADFADQLPFALCLAAAFDMCRDGELRARDYIDLALKAAPAVTDVGVLRTLLGQATSALRRYADPAWRPQGLAGLSATLRMLLMSAAPGSDQQLTYAQVFASVASSPADLELLAGLLDGSASLDGLTIDTDLRWRILHRLVGKGVADEAAIDAEQVRDQSDAGYRYTLTCLAAMPDPGAKESAWASLLRGDLPNATFRAVLVGFTSPDQDDLLAPYESRFFEIVAGKWDDWGPDMAAYFVTRGYPASVISQRAIDDAAAFLANPDLAPPLRRLLSEGRDDVARALRCQQRDAAEAG